MRTNPLGTAAGAVLVAAVLATLVHPAPVGAQTADRKGKPAAHKKVFVTSETYDGRLGGLAGADFKCQTLAAAAGLKGTFRAWLSTTKDQPNGRFNPAIVPYQLVDGTVIAQDWQDLVTSDAGDYLLHGIDRDEYGQPLPASAVWTITAPAGTSNASTDQSCSNWTSNSSQLLTAYGETTYTDARWTSAEAAPCSAQSRLYCFEQ